MQICTTVSHAEFPSQTNHKSLYDGKLWRIYRIHPCKNHEPWQFVLVWKIYSNHQYGSLLALSKMIVHYEDLRKIMRP